MILVCVVCYLIGSIPTGYILTKFFGNVDVRTLGSHSTGATNVLRSGHKWLALMTLLIDGIKGITCTILATNLLQSPEYFIAVFCCIVGHVFPVWLRFKGGKGVATTAGVYVVLDPLFAIISIFVWITFVKLIKISSVASLLLSFTFATLCLSKYVLNGNGLYITLFSVGNLMFLLATHRDNIRRLLNGQER